MQQRHVTTQPNHLFVYGTLMKGFHNHDNLGMGQLHFVGVGRTDGRMISLGAFPGVIPDATKQVVGEVYQLEDAPAAFIQQLDHLEGYSPRRQREENLYCRDVVPVKVGNETIEAWIYHLTYRLEDLDSRYEEVLSGSWRDYETAGAER